MTPSRQPLALGLGLPARKLDRYHLSWDDPIGLLDLLSFDFDILTKWVVCREKGI